MPQFKFRAIDGSGSLQHGTLEAPTAHAAAVHLASQGLRVQAVQPYGAPAPVRPEPSQRVAPVSASVSTPAAVPRATLARQSSTAAPAVVRTRRASNRNLTFLYSQLRSYGHAGVGLNLALERVGSRRLSGHVAAACQEMAKRVGEGRSLADEMARYPDIFPPGDIGAVRAGETGGYLPEALAEVADRRSVAHSNAWIARILRWQVVAAAVSIPLVIAWTVATQKMTDAIVNSEISMTPFERVGYLFRMTGQELTGPTGLALVVGLAAYALLVMWARRTAQMPLRHRAVMRMPVIGRFARDECTASFSDHMGRLSAAGLPPHRAWLLAAQAVPNLAYTARMSEALRGSTDRTSLGEFLQRADVLDPSQASLVATGEATGTVPSAFEHIGKMSKEGAQNNRRMIGVTLLAVGSLAAGALVAIALAIFYQGWYEGLFRAAFRGVYD